MRLQLMLSTVFLLMAIHLSGQNRFGINTTTPQAWLHIKGSYFTVPGSQAGIKPPNILLEGENRYGQISFDKSTMNFAYGSSPTSLQARYYFSPGGLTLSKEVDLTMLQGDFKINQGLILIPNQSSNSGSIFFGGRTNRNENGMRLFGGTLPNGTTMGGFIDVRSDDLEQGLRFRVGPQNGGIQRMIIKANGKIAIGNVATPGNYGLYVEKGILTERVKIAITNTDRWSDFVFEEDYPLPGLQQVESFIEKHKHLPDIPSEKEVRANGVDVVAMDAMLLQKIEEITLYIIDQDKQIKRLTIENEKLQEQVFMLQKEVKKVLK